jgi:group I intron endonuclease
MTKFSVYMVRNIKTGLVYIGATSVSLKRRWHGHCSNAKQGASERGSQIGRAIRECGKDSFEIKPICEAKDRHEMFELEDACIKLFNSTDPTFGYNGKTSGGAIKLSSETLSMMRATWKNKPIICVETGETFLSLQECSRVKGIPAGNICNAIKGRRRLTAGGFTFRYAEDVWPQ